MRGSSALLGCVLLLSGCATGVKQPAPSAPVVAACPAAAPAAAAAAPSPSRAAVRKVLTVVLENHGADETSREMPRLVRLARAYGQATCYRALTHPSLPNYLALASGSTQSVRDDRGPRRHPLPGTTVFDDVLRAGGTARTYAEGMPAPCATSDDGRYAVRHNPWAYFSEAASRQACLVHDVPAGTPTRGALHDDVLAGSLPTVGLLVPDLCHDAHDCSLATADAWLGTWLDALSAGPDWRAGRLAIVVTFDETERSGDNRVLTVVAAPGLAGAVVSAPLSHLSWTSWMGTLIGAPPRAGAPSLGAAFGLR